VPLRLTLRPREKFFLNGAVVVNGETRAELTLLNDVAILREKDILSEAAVDTVCKQVYFLVQLIYIDPRNLADYQAKLGEALAHVAQSIPAAMSDLEQIRVSISEGDYYHALKIARKLISIERELLDHAE